MLIVPAEACPGRPQGVMILVRFFLFGVSLGPLSFLISTEVSAVRLRQKVGQGESVGSS